MNTLGHTHIRRNEQEEKIERMISRITRSTLTVSRHDCVTDQTIIKSFKKAMISSSEAASTTTTTKLPPPTIEQLRIVAYRAAIPVS